MAHPHKPDEQRGVVGGKNLIIALVLNVGITVAQVAGGLISGSLSLLADAAHNASDAAALGISFAARRMSRRPADAVRTFGYRRAEVVGALINLTALLAIAIFLIYLAVRRLVYPPEVHGLTMLIVGAIAFVEDAVSAWLLYRAGRSNINIRAAFIHMMGDTLATLGVIVGGVLIMQYGIFWIDPAITAAIAIYLIVHGYVEIRKAVSILMESAPSGFDLERMVRDIRAVEGVANLHHVHVWQLDEERVALEAHIVVLEADLGTIEQIKNRIKKLLRENFSVSHATLEIEIAGGTAHGRGIIAGE